MWSTGRERSTKTMNKFKGQPEETLQEYAYITFKPKCGHAVGAHVIDVEGAEAAAKFVAESQGGGLIVEIRSVKWARKNLNICSCK